MKKLIICILAVVMLLASTIMTGCIRQDKDKVAEPVMELSTSDENGITLKVKRLYTTGNGVNATSTGELTAYTLTATVTPSTSSNTKVDWSIEWQNPESEFASGKTVTDYVSVTTVNDGNTTATATCKQAFGDEKIVITVTTREGGYSAKCIATFIGRASDINVTNSSIALKNTNARGEYYEIGTNVTYTFDISLGNAYGVVKDKNLTYSVSANGELYFGTAYSSSSSGLVTFSDMQKKRLSDMIDTFITSVSLSGTTLTVKTGSKLVESYCSSSEVDYDGVYYYDNYVYYDEYGLANGTNYTANATYNREAIEDCYFSITITDTVSGVSDEVRLWLVSEVSGVSLSLTSLEF